MSILSDLANQVGRLRSGGIARFHFDRRCVHPERLSDARLDAWITGRLGSAEAGVALKTTVLADAIAPDKSRDGVPLASEIVAVTRVAMRSVEDECAELGVEIDRHSGIADILSLFVFNLVGLVAVERIVRSGTPVDEGDAGRDDMLAEGSGVLRQRAVTLRHMLFRLLRAEAAMNLAYDAVLDGDLAAVRGGLLATLEELGEDDQVRSSILRVLRAIERNAEKS